MIKDNLPTPFIIAELSGNHERSLDKAIALVDAAADAGADAVKLQTFRPSDFVRKGQICDVGPWKGRDMHEVYEEAYTPWLWFRRIQKHAASKGMITFSSPFSEEAIDFLEDYDCPIYKIASFEINYLPLIRKAAQTNKPIIISTGMASQSEIERAAVNAYQAGAKSVTLLKCSSSYPAPVEESNISAIRSLAFHADRVGFSDHTDGSVAAITAVGAGATVFEKHICLEDSKAVDADFAADPDEFGGYVADIREAFAALGSEQLGPSEAEKPYLKYRRKELKGTGLWRRLI